MKPQGTRIQRLAGAIEEFSGNLNSIIGVCKWAIDKPSLDIPKLKGLYLCLNRLKELFDEHKSHIQETGEVLGVIVQAYNDCERNIEEYELTDKDDVEMVRVLPKGVQIRWKALKDAFSLVLTWAEYAFQQRGIKYWDPADLGRFVPPLLVTPCASKGDGSEEVSVPYIV
jgi:hypothetical protein